MAIICGATSIYGCGRELPIESYRWIRNGYLDVVCLECRRKLDRERKDSRKESKNAWKKRNPEKVKAAEQRKMDKLRKRKGIPLYMKHKRKLFNEMGPICARCEKEFPYQMLTVVKEDWYFEEEIDNLILTCMDCYK